MQRRLALLLFLPSLLSGLFVFLLAMGLVGYWAWTYVYDNQLFSGLFSGAYGVQTYLWDVTFKLSALNSTFLRSPVAYYLLVGGIAVAAGVAVFTVLSLTMTFIRQTKETTNAALHPSEQHVSFLRDVVSRLWLRVLSIVGWALYAAFFVSTFLPFTALLTQVGIEAIQANNLNGWWDCLAAVAVLMLSLHVHIIFLRLCLSRPRLFGSAAIEAVEAESEHHIVPY